jgi:hypothetical protein
MALGVASVDGEANGLQLACGLSRTGGTFHGLQASSGVNFAREMRGFQAAAGVSIAAGTAAGLQTSGGANVAGRIAGLQCAAVNIAEELVGLQVGVVNIGGKARGLQVGVVNIADEMHGVPIGLVNIAGDGIFRFDAWSTDMLPVNAALRFGSRYVYTVVGAGGTASSGGTEQAPALWTPLFGLGARLPLGRVSVNADVLGGSLYEGSIQPSADNAIATARLFAEVRILKRLHVFAGPALNAQVRWADAGAPAGRDLSPSWTATKVWAETWDAGSVTATGRAWLGFAAGVSF